MDLQRVPLREWAKRSSSESINTTTLGESQPPAAPSDPFLISALKAAVSLADQLCKLEETAVSIYSENGSQNEGLINSRLLPLPGTDWASQIVICVKPCDGNDEKKESCRVMDGIASLNVEGSELLPSLANDTRGNANEKNERIFSLGIVFYVLFSGGSIPPELASIEPSSPNLFTASNSIINPLSINDASSIDVGDALRILDDLSEEDEPFGPDSGQNEDEIHHQNKKSRDSSARSSSGTLCLVSVDPLRLQLLPAALCDLVENMLDSINGVFSKDESYREMQDVRNDLQLMLEKPVKFFYDQDLVTLATTGLQLKDFEHATSNEFSTLVAAYNRSIVGRSELAIITGPSGVGKSVLAKQLASWASSNGAVFLSGKFDQFRQAGSLSAIVEALNEYCGVLLRDKEPNCTQVFTFQLGSTLGDDAYYLAKIIPNLGRLLNQKTSQNDFPEQDYQNGQKRLQHLLCQLMEVISRSSAAPIILFSDDLQWADPSSIEVIQRLLLLNGSSNKRSFFFLGCCRENETCTDRPVWKMISAVRNFGINTTTVSLSCMDKEGTNTVLSHLLCLSPRLTRSLSEVLHHKTKGNLLFFSRLLRTLSKEGLLWPSLSRRRWLWDEEEIERREVPEDVAIYFTSTIRQLSKEVQSALFVLSCFGKSTEQFILETLERELKIHLIDSLDVAVAEGLLDKVDAVYKFSHDRVQISAYNISPQQERCILHSKYGLALCTQSLHSENDSIFFAAVGQMNRGGPAVVSSTAQRVNIANLNLVAGKKSIHMSDHASAFSYFDHGIRFLENNCWNENYKLSLDLFEGASKSAFVIGDMDSLDVFSDQIMKNAQSFEDKLNTLYITTNALAYASKLQESMEKALSILTQLGEEISADCSTSDVEFEADKTLDMLKQISDDDLKSYKTMSDSSKIMAMKFLAKLNNSLFMTRPNLQPVLTLRMVQLSLAYGMSPFSPVGFANFGAFVAMLGDIRAGYRFVKIAKDLNDRYGSREVAGEVICVCTQIMSYVMPIQSANEYHIEGYHVSMAAGNMSSAILNSLRHCVCSFWSGSKLPMVKQLMEQSRCLMDQQHHLMWKMHFVPLERSVLTLIGEHTGTNEEVSGCRETAIERSLIKKNSFQSSIFHFQKMYISFIFRDFDQTKEFAEKRAKHQLPSWTLLYLQSTHAFFTGLVSFWICRKTNKDSVWEQRGQEAIASLKLFTESCSWNFEHKLLLLEAEEQYFRRNFEGAKSLYDKAIASAKEHKFTSDEALACEIAGYFYLEIGEKGTSVDYFTKAHLSYHEWGAFAKASKLFDFVENALVSPLKDVSALSTLCGKFNDRLEDQNSNGRKRDHVSLP